MSGLNPSLNTDTVLAKNQASLDFAKQNLENTYQQETDIRESNFLNAFDQNLFDLSENDIEKINLFRNKF